MSSNFSGGQSNFIWIKNEIMNTRQKCECQEGIEWHNHSPVWCKKVRLEWMWLIEPGRKLSDISLSPSLIHTHKQKNTQTHTHTCVRTSQAQVSWEQGQRSHRLNYLAPCQRVFTEKATIQPCCLGLLWPVIGKGVSSQEENKNHKKKIFKCFFIILSGLFKMISIYGNEPLNEAI